MLKFLLLIVFVVLSLSQDLCNQSVHSGRCSSIRSPCKKGNIFWNYPEGSCSYQIWMTDEKSASSTFKLNVNSLYNDEYELKLYEEPSNTLFFSQKGKGMINKSFTIRTNRFRAELKGPTKFTHFGVIFDWELE